MYELDHQKIVLVRRNTKASPRMGSITIDTLLEKVDFSIKLRSFASILNLTSFSKAFVKSRLAVSINLLIIYESQNRVRGSLLKRCTLNTFPSFSYDRSMTPRVPSYKQDILFSSTNSFFSSSVKFSMQVFSTIIWWSTWNMCKLPWKLMTATSIMQRSSALCC